MGVNIQHLCSNESKRDREAVKAEVRITKKISQEKEEPC